jgi:hypothetical protein
MRSCHIAPQQGGCHCVLEHLLHLGNENNFINKTRKEGGEARHIAPQHGSCHCVLEHLLLLGNNKDNLLKNKEGRR